MTLNNILNKGANSLERLDYQLDAIVRCSGELEIRVGAILERLNNLYPNGEISEEVPENLNDRAEMVLEDFDRINDLLFKVEVMLGIA